MKVIDYNGVGKWSRDAILERYAKYCAEMHIDGVPLDPQVHQEGDTKWVYSVMEKVIAGIENGDPACRLIGIEFIEEDERFPFGKILKSNTARSLRRAELTNQEQERIRKRIVAMLLAGNVPHEFKEYAKLLKKIGLGSYASVIEREVGNFNQFSMKYYEYLKNA